MRERGAHRTDRARVKAMTQEQVERLADEADAPLPEVLRWFKAQGPGYQTRINAVLRAFLRARQEDESAHRRKAAHRA
jgi:uncharacterized protein (DUF4415 family)